MRVLHLHSSDNVRAAGGVLVMDRLHRALKARGVDSRLLVGARSGSPSEVTQIRRNRRLEAALGRITLPLGLNDVHAVSAFGITSDPAYRAADLLHIHGPHSNFFSYLALPKITAGKPTLLTLHDMWALTGHCAVSYDCERWRSGCGACPYPEANPAVRRDATALDWRLKRWSYGRSRMAVAAPSRWLAERARESMLGRFPVHYLPHGLDTRVYEPLDPEKCRELLGLPPGKLVLMFAAVRLNQRSKGGDLLAKALHALPETLRRELTLLLLGDGGEAFAAEAGLPAVCLGYVGSDRLKAIAYSAADLFVSPTRAEAFGLTLLEAMACGVPLVSFDVGGTAETVRPGVTGYLARREDPEDLARGIVELLGDRAGRERMGGQGRAIALAEYTLELFVERHLELYRQLVSEPARATAAATVPPARWEPGGGGTGKEDR
jgi:glycosyltransferase involved in cell wall biosynthesis